MCDMAWYIFLRCLQLCAFVLLCSFAMLAQNELSPSYDMYMTAMALFELAPAFILFAGIASVCIEEYHG